MVEGSSTCPPKGRPSGHGKAGSSGEASKYNCALPQSCPSFLPSVAPSFTPSLRPPSASQYRYLYVRARPAGPPSRALCLRVVVASCPYFCFLPCLTLSFASSLVLHCQCQGFARLHELLLHSLLLYPALLDVPFRSLAVSVRVDGASCKRKPLLCCAYAQQFRRGHLNHDQRHISPASAIACRVSAKKVADENQGPYLPGSSATSRLA